MKLLVAVDLSESTQTIVEKVEEINKEYPAKVWILHNAEPEPDILEFKVDPLAARETLAKKFHNEHRQIQEIANRLRKAGLSRPVAEHSRKQRIIHPGIHRSGKPPHHP